MAHANKTDAQVSQQNLIKNPTFAVGENGALTDWYLQSANGSGTGPAQPDDYRVEDGRYIDLKKRTRLRQELPLEAGKMYKLIIEFSNIVKDPDQWAASGGVEIGLRNKVFTFTTTSSKVFEHSFSVMGSTFIEIGNLDHYAAHSFEIDSISLVEDIRFGDELILNGDFIEGQKEWKTTQPSMARVLSGDGKSFYEVRADEVLLEQTFVVPTAGDHVLEVKVARADTIDAEPAYVRLNGDSVLELRPVARDTSQTADVTLPAGQNLIEIVAPTSVRRLEIDQISVRLLLTRV